MNRSSLLRKSSSSDAKWLGYHAMDWRAAHFGSSGTILSRSMRETMALMRWERRMRLIALIGNIPGCAALSDRKVMRLDTYSALDPGDGEDGSSQTSMSSWYVRFWPASSGGTALGSDIQ